jgi:lysophospholipase L1-like esterase
VSAGASFRAIGALVLAGVVLVAQIPAALAESDGSRSATAPVIVAAMGDSLTDPRAQGGKYLDVLRARCPKSRFDSYGIGGQMVNQMRKRVDDDVFGPGKPTYTHVIVFGGVNDLYSDLTAGRTPALVERDLAAMYSDVHAHGAKAVAMTVAPWGGFTRFFNASRAAATLEVNRWILSQRTTGLVDAVVDAYGLLSCGDASTLCPRYTAPFRDGLHFGDEGHKVLGEALFTEAFSRCE